MSIRPRAARSLDQLQFGRRARFNEPIATSSFDHGEHEVKGAFVRVRPLARGAAKLAEKTRQEILIRRTQRSHEEALPSFEIRVVNGKHIRDRHL